MMRWAAGDTRLESVPAKMMDVKASKAPHRITLFMLGEDILIYLQRGIQESRKHVILDIRRTVIISPQFETNVQTRLNIYIIYYYQNDSLDWKAFYICCYGKQ